MFMILSIGSHLKDVKCDICDNEEECAHEENLCITKRSINSSKYFKDEKDFLNQNTLLVVS